MKHCNIILCRNEHILLKYKLPFLYKHFTQIIFVDYDIMYDTNSNDGSIEFIKNYPDPENKIILLTDFKEIKDTILDYNGKDINEYQKMFAYASKHVADDIDLVWGVDLDEMFNTSLIFNAEKEYEIDDQLISIDCSWKTFIYNQYNILNENERNLGYYPIRITKHFKGKVYGHCNWRNYGKIKTLKNEYIYHYAYIGPKRCYSKLVLYNTKTTSKHLQDEWCKQYLTYLKKNFKHVDLVHPGSRKRCIQFDGPFPEEINIDQLVKELNKSI